MANDIVAINDGKCLGTVFGQGWVMHSGYCRGVRKGVKCNREHEHGPVWPVGRVTCVYVVVG